MAKITKGEQTHVLTEREVNLLKIMNIALHYNELKQRVMSGFLYYVCTNKFGYKEDENLVFEIDLDKDDNELKVRSIPTDQIKAAIQDQDITK